MRKSAPRAFRDSTPGFDAEAGRTAAITLINRATAQAVAK